MRLSTESVRQCLDSVATEGWDGPGGTALLLDVRQVVVKPLVRASGLRGPAAQQAESTAWQVCWEVLCGNGANATNPAGMLWVAARRAIAKEVVAGRGRAHPDGEDHRAASSSWDPGSSHDPADEPSREGRLAPATECGGSVLPPIIDLLVAVGWPRKSAAEVVLALVDELGVDARGSRWRCVARRLSLPQWQVRRVAQLLLGDPRTEADSKLQPGGATPGLAELVLTQGPEILGDARSQAAARSSLKRNADSPRWHLQQLAQACLGGDRPDQASAVPTAQSSLDQGASAASALAT